MSIIGYRGTYGQMSLLKLIRHTVAGKTRGRSLGANSFRLGPNASQEKVPRLQARHLIKLESAGIPPSPDTTKSKPPVGPQPSTNRRSPRQDPPAQRVRRVQPRAKRGDVLGCVRPGSSAATRGPFLGQFDSKSRISAPSTPNLRVWNALLDLEHCVTRPRALRYSTSSIAFLDLEHCVTRPRALRYSTPNIALLDPEHCVPRPRALRSSTPSMGIFEVKQPTVWPQLGSNSELNDFLLPSFCCHSCLGVFQVVLAS